MNVKVINTAMFVAGVAVGSVITWKVVSNRYEKKIQTEIDSVKETYSKRPIAHVAVTNINNGIGVEEVEEEDNIERKKRVEEIISEQGYINYSNFSKTNSDESKESDHDEEDPDGAQNDSDEDTAPIMSAKEDDGDRPYVIAPWEFGEMDGYEKISLTYYADGILADEMNELVESVDSIVGLDSLDRFGEYEDDSVFVRNDTLKCDYEILKDIRRWEDIVNPPKIKGGRRTTQQANKPPQGNRQDNRKPHQMEGE